MFNQGFKQNLRAFIHISDYVAILPELVLMEQIDLLFSHRQL
jgi:hypothetical protein